MQKQSINLNFQQGLNTKTDPWQLPIGQFQVFNNAVFTTGNLFALRPGYGSLPTPNTSNYLCTYNGNLMAIGKTVNAYISQNNTWQNESALLYPCSLNVVPLVRNSLNQVQTDSATSNGLTCVVYTESYSDTFGVNTSYNIAILDANSGQILAIPFFPTLGGGADTSYGPSRVVVANGYFVIVSPVSPDNGVTTYLQYFTVPLNAISTSSAAQYVYSDAITLVTPNPNWDVVTVSDGIFVAYNRVSSAAIVLAFLTNAQIASNSTSTLVKAMTAIANLTGTLVNLCADLTVSPNYVYLNYYASDNAVYGGVFYHSGSSITQVYLQLNFYATANVVNMSACAQNNVCILFQEISGSYAFDTTIPNNNLHIWSVDNTGAVTGPGNDNFGLGLASKGLAYNGNYYFLTAYQSPYQPSYFLIQGTNSAYGNNFVAKLAYQNGGGYLKNGLPSFTLNGNVGTVSYLYKQNVEALNVESNTQASSVGGIYSQLGINQAAFTLGTQAITTLELSGDLQISGGFLASFDGYSPVENNFFLFPDSVEATNLQNSARSTSGVFSNASYTIVLGSATGIAVGMTIVDTSNPSYIPTGTKIVYINGTTITINKATTHANGGGSDNVTIQGNVWDQPDGKTNFDAYYYRVCYACTDARGNTHRSAPSVAVAVSTTPAGTSETGTNTLYIPTLRVSQRPTYIQGPGVIKIEVYRWSAATQVYNEVTSITAPLLNNSYISYVTFVDPYADSDIIGNTILYTTGGVVPDTNGPASNVITAFDTRLVMIDAEDTNLLWISKTVVEGTPVEMSSDFTIYVAPNVGTVGSTGGMKTLFPMDDKLLIGKKGTFFYMNGTGPDNLGTTSPGSPLGNYSPPIFITSAAGCTNQASQVLTPDGMMFQNSNDGQIWLISRNLETSFIGAPVSSYLSGNTVTSANVIPNTTYVVFTLSSGIMVMFDYYYRQWGTFSSSGLNPIVSSCIYNGLHTLIDNTGAVLQQTPGTYLDGSTPVLMNFTTAWINLAGLQGYQRLYDFALLANYLTAHQWNIEVSYDYSSSYNQLTTITPTNTSTSVEQWRIHAKKQLCQSFQISLQQIYTGTAGAGFTMSGINCQIGIKKGLRPFAGRNTAG